MSTADSLQIRLSESRTRWLAFAAVLLLHAQFVLGLSRWLWGREHYQFFPFILLGFAWLAWSRLTDAVWQPAGFTPRVLLYAAVSLGLYAAAAVTGSNWMGVVALIGGLWTLVWLFGGEPVAEELQGPFLFLLLIVPLPLNLDLDLIVGLQKTATSLASMGLDAIGIRHVVSGVAIRTPTANFMVEEACSGIHSLFSAVTAVVFFGVYCRYGLPRLVLLVLQGVFWVVVANCLRVFLIVYARERMQLELDSGWRHQLLGIGTYTLAVLMTLSSDQFVRFLFPVVTREQRVALGGSRKGPVTRLFEPLSRMLDRTRLPSRAGLAALAVFLVAGYLPLAAYAVSKSLGGNAKQESRNFAGSVLEVGDESLLPQEVGVWSRAAFETVSRDPDDPFGANSLVWTYTGMGLEVQFSVDGYYPSWHDLNYCYTGAGWQRSGGRNLGDAVVWTELDLFQEPSTYAVSMFSCFDSKLTPVKPPPVSGSKLRTVVNRLRAWNFIDDAAGQQVTPPVFQLQLFVKSGRELYPHEVDEIRKLYRRLSDDFVKAQANKK